MAKPNLSPNQLLGLKAVVSAGEGGLAPTVRGPTSGKTFNSLRDAGLVRIEGTSDTRGPNKGVRRVFATEAGRGVASGQ